MPCEVRHLTPSKNTNQFYTPVMVYLRSFLSEIAEMRVNVALSDRDTRLAWSNVKLCRFVFKHSSVQNAKTIVFFSLGQIQRLRALTHSTGMLITHSWRQETKAMKGTNHALFNHSSTSHVKALWEWNRYLNGFLGQMSTFRKRNCGWSASCTV